MERSAIRESRCGADGPGLRCAPSGLRDAPGTSFNPTPNNRGFRPRDRRAQRRFCVTPASWTLQSRLRRKRDHGSQSPSSHRGFRHRRCRRAGDVARCRACGAPHLAAWARRHAIRRPARQPGRADPGLAARHRRGGARAGAAGAAAGGLPHRHASANRTARNSWACAARPGSFSSAAHRCFRAKARQRRPDRHHP